MCSVFLAKSMQKLFFLVERCFQLREPVLLVGETGGGKTIVCQLLSAYLQLKLHILNYHKHTETSYFIVGFRPLRERSRLISNYKEIVEQLKKLEGFRYFLEEPLVSSDIEQATSTLDMLNGYKEASPSFTAKLNNVDVASSNLQYGTFNTNLASSGCYVETGQQQQQHHLFQQKGHFGTRSESSMADNSQQTDDKTHCNNRAGNGELVVVDSNDQTKLKHEDQKTLHRLAQNCEAARKIRLRKKGVFAATGTVGDPTCAVVGNEEQ
ncbi:hypothetical protein S83_046932, partial [Arachis hypogaea]